MASSPRLTGDQMAQLRALEGRKPDTKDILEAPAANWKHAQRGGSFWKARKEAISLRVDMDVLDWLRRQGPGYQTTIIDPALIDQNVKPSIHTHKLALSASEDSRQ